ncbi:MAG: VanZ family protein [Chloroflexota bacterium]
MNRLKNWLPALGMMAAIFTLSSIPSEDIPRFGAFDFSVKKLGHSIGYALLAAAYARALGLNRNRLAWALALLFAASDEFHQSFTPGRSPSPMDVLVYDNLGALAGLWFYRLIWEKKNARPPSAQ